jgi:hypothetical protein
MNPKLSPSTKVVDESNQLEGHLVGPFVRKEEQWWTVYWTDHSTTAMKEKDILGG